MGIGGISIWQLLIILVIVLMLFGLHGSHFFIEVFNEVLYPIFGSKTYQQ